MGMTPDEFTNEAKVPARRQPGWGGQNPKTFVWVDGFSESVVARIVAHDYLDALNKAIAYLSSPDAHTLAPDYLAPGQGPMDVDAAEAHIAENGDQILLLPDDVPTIGEQG